MSLIPLITSVPPQAVRYDQRGNEIGAAYQEKCIRSWIEAGFAPISVNNQSEEVPFADLLRVVRVERTAKELHGRPVVFIADLCKAAREAAGGPVLMINADILLQPSFNLSGVVAGLRSNQAIVGRRIDIKDPEHQEGTAYEGFDAFMAHGTAFAAIPDETFAVGLHWWDSALPMAFDDQELEIHVLSEPYAYHLIHGKRWDDEEWIKLGLIYANRVVRMDASRSKLAKHIALANIAITQSKNADRLKAAVSIAKRVSRPLGNRLEKMARSRLRKSLRRLAQDSSSSINTLFASNIQKLGVGTR